MLAWYFALHLGMHVVIQAAKKNFLAGCATLRCFLAGDSALSLAGGSLLTGGLEHPMLWVSSSTDSAPLTTAHFEDPTPSHSYLPRIETLPSTVTQPKVELTSQLTKTVRALLYHTG